MRARSKFFTLIAALLFAVYGLAAAGCKGTLDSPPVNERVPAVPAQPEVPS
ncbi:hypothetical protein H7I94_17110 [Mycobacterium szulgai]|nr:hypothetical protein [Mycobacterium szulgai]